jgi:hypothetical protein
MERERGLEQFAEGPDKEPKKKISRRDALKAIIGGGVAGAALLRGEKAEAASGLEQEAGEGEFGNVMRFQELLTGVEQYFQNRTTVDEAAKARAENDLAALREQFGPRAVDFAQRTVMEKLLAEGRPDADPENTIATQDKLEFVSQVFGNQAFQEIFRSKLAGNLEELQQSPELNRGYVQADIPVGGRNIDTIVSFSFGRPARDTEGIQAQLTAERAAEVTANQMWQEEIAPQFSNRWARLNTVPPSNDFQFSVPVKAGLEGWEDGTIFRIEAYGRAR